MGMIGKLLPGVLAAVFLGAGCRSVELQKAEIPENFAVPSAYTAVFEFPASGRMVVYGDAESAQFRRPPCSTFKIISTLMGLNAQVVTGKESRLGYDGSKYEFEAWNKDVTLLEAFRSSCVPYYKKMIGKLDQRYVQNILTELDYGNCDISVWNSNGHNVFWIESSLLISPVEQVRVMKKIFSGDSIFALEHVALLKECMAAGKAGEFTLYGKTGTGRNHNSNHLEAWFVGFAEAPNGEKIFFAAHGADPKRNVVSSEIRESIRELLQNFSVL